MGKSDGQKPYPVVIQSPGHAYGIKDTRTAWPGPRCRSFRCRRGTWEHRQPRGEMSFSWERLPFSFWEGLLIGTFEIKHAPLFTMKKLKAREYWALDSPRRMAEPLCIFSNSQRRRYFQKRGWGQFCLPILSASFQLFVSTWLGKQ